MYVASQEELWMLKNHNKHLYCRLELLDKDLNVIDNLEGLTIDGNLSIDADSDIRHTFTSTIYLKKNQAISSYSVDEQIDKLVRVYVGMRPAGGNTHWYAKGIYAFNQNGFSYDASTHSVSISCVDLVAMLDGSLSGTLTGYKTLIPTGEKISKAIIETFKLSGMNDYIVNYWNRTVPYDLEFSSETSIWDILKELRDLYYPFEMFFNDATFVCQEIPSGFDDPVVLNNEVFQDLVISENGDVDYTEVKNCVEVFGASIEYNTYVDEEHLIIGQNSTTEEEAEEKIKANSQYINVQKEYDDYVNQLKVAGINKYGNIDNTSRARIIWTKENLEKYSDFVSEVNRSTPGLISEGDYSTVLTADDSIEGIQVAYTQLFQKDDELIPLTKDIFWNYFNSLINKCKNNGGSITATSLLNADATGLTETVYGESLLIKNMIVAVEGESLNSGKLSAADVSAIAGQTADELQEKYGVSSVYIGFSAHTIHENLYEKKDNITLVHDRLYEEYTNKDTSVLTFKTTNLDTSNDSMIAFTTPILGLSKHINITIINSVTETDNDNNTSTKEYTHGPYKLYATDVDEKGTDVEMDGTVIAPDMMIVVQYSPTYKKFYYRGEQQTHAMAFLVSKMPTEKEIAQAKETEACNNIKYICLTDDNVNLNTQANPRFTIEKIGRRNKVCSGSEFEMYTTDESTMQCTEYMLQKCGRLTDSVTVECLLVPWLDVNQKISYIPRYIDTNGEPLDFIIKKISITLGEGTMTLTLSRYYPYYPYIVQNKY